MSDSMGHNSNEQLKSIIERIERLEEKKAAITADIKDIYTEAKANGYDTKVLRKLVALRKKDAAKREEEQAILETYMHALGMLSDTPLGQAALKAAKKFRDTVTKDGGSATIHIPGHEPVEIK